MKNYRSTRDWLLAYAALYGSTSHTVHRRTYSLADLLPTGTANRPTQMCANEPLHRLSVSPDHLGGLALGSQVQPERADLRLEAPGIQRLKLTER